MHSHRNWIAVIGCMFLAVAVATSQVRLSIRSQAQEGDPHSIVRDNMVQVRVEVLALHDGLPEGGTSSSNLVGRRLGRQSIQKDDSGNAVYDMTIDGESQWLPGNVIKVTLEITENDIKRTETLVLEGFEPKTLVLNEDPADDRRELLRVIPVFGLVGANQKPCKSGTNSEQRDSP